MVMASKLWSWLKKVFRSPAARRLESEELEKLYLALAEFNDTLVFAREWTIAKAFGRGRLTLAQRSVLAGELIELHLKDAECRWAQVCYMAKTGYYGAQLLETHGVIRSYLKWFMAEYPQCARALEALDQDETQA